MENDKILTPKESEDTNAPEESRDTTPEIPEGTVKIKFNKEEKEIPISEASALAQKGLKFDLISEDYSRLRDMAQKSGLSVRDFLNEVEKNGKQKRKDELIELSGGNEELADHVLSLESESDKDSGDFNELKEQFPEINEIGELPSEVVEAAGLKGSRLLDEYLRYLLRTEREKKAQAAAAQKAQKAGVGSQISSPAAPLANEFIKGLWNR